MFAAFVHQNRAYLSDVEPQLFDRCVRYLLDPRVMGIVADGPEGTQPHPDILKILLHYEHEIRKLAMTYVEEGMSFGKALEKAWTCTELKGVEFTEIILHGGRKRFSSEANPRARATSFIEE